MFKQEKNVFHVKTKRKLRFYYSTVKFREKRAECQLVASVILLVASVILDKGAFSNPVKSKTRLF